MSTQTGQMMKTEEEVKEYLENLGIEYRYGCLKEKDPEVCLLLGDFLDSVKQEFEKAGNVYKNNCIDNKHARSCLKFGSFCILGRGVKEDTGEALKYFKLGCDYGSATSCTKAGAMCTARDTRLSKLQDYPAGVEYLKKGCEGGDGPGCYLLSGIFMMGIKGLIDKSMEKAFPPSVKACELGIPQACANVSIMYNRGEGIDKNEGQAKEFRTKAEKLFKQQQPDTSVKFQQGLPG